MQGINALFITYAKNNLSPAHHQKYQNHNIWYIQTVFPLQTHHIVCTIIHMTTNPHPTRTRSQVEDITKILNLAADSVRKTKLAGFGKIILTVTIRHGAICESIIEESNTQTVKF